jgi:hypothetical protein
MSKVYPKQMKRAGYIGMLGSEKEGLAFLKTKARETKNHSLLSATLLNEAKVYLVSVGKVLSVVDAASLTHSRAIRFLVPLNSYFSHLISISRKTLEITVPIYFSSQRSILV